MTSTAAAANYTFTLKVNNATSDIIQFSAKVQPPSPDTTEAPPPAAAYHWNDPGCRLSFSYALNSNEEVYGVGEQYTVHGLRHRVVPVVTTEQGVGRGLQPVSTFVDVGSKLHNAAGNWHTTYTSIPHFLTSDIRSMYINDTRYMELDIGVDDSTKMNITVIVGIGTSQNKNNNNNNNNNNMTTTAPIDWTLSGYIYHGQEPKDLIQQHTSIVGRMSPVAEWVSNTGIVVGWEGGTKKVLELHAQLMAANISVAGYWLQDWSGLRIDPFGKR